MTNFLALHNDPFTLHRILSLVVQLSGYDYVSTEEALVILESDQIDLFIMSYQLPNKRYCGDFYEMMKADPKLKNVGVIILWPRTDSFIDVYAYGDRLLYRDENR